MRKFFRAGFFGGLGVITAFFIICLLIFLLLAGVFFLDRVASRSPTPEAALQQLLGGERKYQVIAKRKLSDNSENKVLFVYCSENSEGTYMQACVQGQPIATRSCIVAAQRLGGWEVAEITNDGNCYLMLQTGRTLD